MLWNRCPWPHMVLIPAMWLKRKDKYCMSAFEASVTEDTLFPAKWFGLPAWTDIDLNKIKVLNKDPLSSTYHFALDWWQENRQLIVPEPNASASDGGQRKQHSVTKAKKANIRRPILYRVKDVLNWFWLLRTYEPELDLDGWQQLPYPHTMRYVKAIQIEDIAMRGRDSMQMQIDVTSAQAKQYADANRCYLSSSP
jgi:hypothetical protein